MEKKNYGLLAYILVCIIWGSIYLAIRIGVQSFPPFLFGGIRFIIAGTYAYINPIVAMFLGWLFLSEHITAKMVISTVLILTGVIIVQRSKVVEKVEEKIEA